VSLIEAVVTVGIVSASVVTLVGALGAAEKSAGTQTRDSHVQVALRTLADDLSNNTLVPYNLCTTSGSPYQDALNDPSLQLQGVTVTSVAVQRPTVPGSGPRLTTTSTCSTNPDDHGVQRLTITATTGSATGNIVVWKSYSTTASPAPTTPTPSPTP
jgi:hypothetical protein